MACGKTMFSRSNCFKRNLKRAPPGIAPASSGLGRDETSVTGVSAMGAA